MNNTLLLHVKLDGLPPTVNTMYRTNYKSRTRHKTPETKEWQEKTTLIFKASHDALRHFEGPCEGNVSLEILINTPDKKRWDLDNRVKALQDCLAPAGVILDDRQVRRLVVNRLIKKGTPAGTYVSVWEL